MAVSQIEFYGWLSNALTNYLDGVPLETLKDSSLPALGLDSLEIVELFMEVEDHFGVQLPMDTLSDYMTLDELWVCFNAVVNQNHS